MEGSYPIDFLKKTGLFPVVAASAALVLAYTAAALAVSGAPLVVLAGLLAGVLGWTLAEYVKHRFFDHEDAGHLAHHRAPLEDIRISKGGRQAVAVARNALLLSAPGTLGALALDRAAGGAALAGAGGFLAGYAAYRIVHVACHELPMRHPVAAHLKRHHAIHHFRDEAANFGITTSLWDHVFGTAWKAEAGRGEALDGEGRSP